MRYTRWYVSYRHQVATTNMSIGPTKLTMTYAVSYIKRGGRLS
ncbi:MAG: hypothetical protein RR657_07280 [Peptostreptococcaceae bacterium]